MPGMEKVMSRVMVVRVALVGGLVGLVAFMLLALGADAVWAGPLKEIGHNVKGEGLGTVQQLFVLGVVVVFAILGIRRLFPLMLIMFFVCGFLGWIVFTPDSALGTMRDVFDSFKPGGGGGGDAGGGNPTGGASFK